MSVLVYPIPPISLNKMFNVTKSPDLSLSLYIFQHHYDGKF